MKEFNAFVDKFILDTGIELGPRLFTVSDLKRHGSVYNTSAVYSVNNSNVYKSMQCLS